MVRKIALFAILGLFVAVFAVSAQTAGTTQPQPGSSTDTADMSKDHNFKGKIDKIDTVAKTIAVKIDPSGEVRVFTFDDKTAFEIKGKDVKIEKIKVGDQIELESDAANLAVKVKVKPIAPKATTTEDDPDADNPDKE